MSRTGAQHLRTALVARVAAAWPNVLDLRAAARALGQKERLRNGVSILANELRVLLSAAHVTASWSSAAVGAGLLSLDDDAAVAAAAERACVLCECARMTVSDAADVMRSERHWSEAPAQASLLQTRQRLVVGLAQAPTGVIPMASGFPT